MPLCSFLFLLFAAPTSYNPDIKGATYTLLQTYYLLFLFLSPSCLFRSDCSPSEQCHFCQVRDFLANSRVRTSTSQIVVGKVTYRFLRSLIQQIEVSRLACWSDVYLLLFGEKMTIISYIYMMMNKHSY